MGQHNPVGGICPDKVIYLSEGVGRLSRIGMTYRFIGVEEEGDIGPGTDFHDVSQGLDHFRCQPRAVNR